MANDQSNDVQSRERRLELLRKLRDKQSTSEGPRQDPRAGKLGGQQAAGPLAGRERLRRFLRQRFEGRAAGAAGGEGASGTPFTQHRQRLEQRVERLRAALDEALKELDVVRKLESQAEAEAGIKMDVPSADDETKDKSTVEAKTSAKRK